MENKKRKRISKVEEETRKRKKGEQKINEEIDQTLVVSTNGLLLTLPKELWQTHIIPELSFNDKCALRLSAHWFRMNMGKSWEQWIPINHRKYTKYKENIGQMKEIEIKGAFIDASSDELKVGTKELSDMNWLPPSVETIQCSLNVLMYLEIEFPITVKKLVVTTGDRFAFFRGLLIREELVRLMTKYPQLSITSNHMNILTFMIEYYYICLVGEDEKLKWIELIERILKDPNYKDINRWEPTDGFNTLPLVAAIDSYLDEESCYDSRIIDMLLNYEPPKDQPERKVKINYPCLYESSINAIVEYKNKTRFCPPYVYAHENSEESVDLCCKLLSFGADPTIYKRKIVNGATEYEYDLVDLYYLACKDKNLTGSVKALWDAYIKYGWLDVEKMKNKVFHHNAIEILEIE